MFSQSTADGLLTLTVTFALGTDLDNAQVQVQNRVAQALPRLPAGSAAHRRGHREGVARPDDGRAPRLARRALRHAVPVELRPPAGEGRAGAHRRRRQRAGVRRRRVQHARVARSRPAGGAAADRHRRRARHPRAERPGGGRRARRAAGADRHDVPAVDQRAGPARRRRSSSRDIVVRATPDGQITRLRDVGRVELGSNTLRAAQPARQPAGRGDRHLAAARVATRSRRRSQVRAADGAAEAGVSRRAWTTASSTTRRSTCASRSTRSSRRSSRPSSWWSSSCWSSCRRGARRSSRWSPCRCRSSARSP